MLNPFTYPGRQSGMSLVELMVAIAIGTILMTGLVAMFTNSSQSRRELEKTGVLIENGRYATSLLYDDIRHAGFYGYYYASMTAPGSLPDPCETGSLTNLKDAMAVPIQGYAAADLTTRPDVSGTTCDDKGLLTAANLSPGSDVVVVRRADTAVYTGNPVSQDIYLQANVRDANLMLGNASANVPTDSADNNSTTNLSKYPSKPTNTTIAETRKFEVHVYFVAPCSKGTGTNDVCQSGDDSIPTLKRLVLTSDGTNTKMEIEPLVEGIEFMKASYGIDTSPGSANSVTGETGDGMPDSYTATPGTAQWPLVDGIKLYLLVRSSEPTQDYKDLKTYTLDTTSVPPFNDKYYRHVFSTQILCMDMAGRREIPE